MTILQRIFSICVLLTLTACGGGGGDAGTSGFGGSGSGSGGGTSTPTATPPTASDLVLSLSASTVANSGGESVVATATTLDANRNTLAGVPVTFSVNNNAIATPAGQQTGTSGQLSAAIGIGTDRSTRVITVTATTGTISRTAQLTVQEVGGQSTAAPADLLLTLSAPTISSSGAQSVTATATALDARRNVLPGAVVAISVNAGATVAPSGSTTGANGAVTGVIGIGSDSSLRTITVTATAVGLSPRTTTLQVVPTTSTVPVASDLSIALSAGTVANTGSASVTATVTAVDGNRNALPGIPVSISVDNNAVATVSSSTTNIAGVVTAAIGVGADRSNRSITITATSGLVTRSATVAVVGATLSASFSPRVDAGSVDNEIEYRLVDATETPMAAQSITVTSPGLPSASGLTDPNGRFRYRYAAPNSAQTLQVSATAAGDTRVQVIAVQAVGNTLPTAALPQSASLTPTPSVVSVNAAGSTTNQVELRALFLGVNNSPVPNVRVRFSVDPANSSDGTATQLGGGTYAFSDATGVARGVFTPGQRSSPTNGITVRGCWGVDDFDPLAACPVNRQISATLTIASEALSVNIRTNNLIKSGAAGLTYIKEYVVMVVDAAGQAKADILITPSVDLTGYLKGRYFFSTGSNAWVQRVQLASNQNWRWNSSSSSWEQQPATSPPQPICPNEDFNRNGVREAPPFVSGATAPAIAIRQEDLNWNGDIDPRKADVAVRVVGSPRTDSSGLAIIQIEYGQNVASWVDFVITVTASGIAGTEARARYVGQYYGLGNLPYPASAVTDANVAPAFVVSPYGAGSVTADGVASGVCTDTD